MKHTLKPAVAGCLVTVLALGVTGAASAARPNHARRAGVGTAQQLAMLNHDTGVFAAPSMNSKRVTELLATRPITGERTVVPVIRGNGARGRRWLEVLLPGRPNSHSGWIRRRATTESFTRWRIAVRLSTETVTVFHDGRIVQTFRAVVGKPTTPTPTGTFFVEETVALYPQQSGAPYALALSARSNALREFDGGPGQIAFHGIENIGGIPGTAASHGCMRLATAAITWLSSHIAPGVPVTISS